MRQNARKPKPNPGNNRRHCIRSSSIRDIIGDRRFNVQFSHENRTEGIKKVKNTKVGDSEVHDLPKLGRNASSVRCEATENPRCCYGDSAAKTSEYAFFKRMKENTSSMVEVHPNYHDNQPKKVQLSDHFTREEVPNVQKESIEYSKSSLPIVEQRNDAHRSFLTPSCSGSKNSVMKNFGHEATNVQFGRPAEYNWGSPIVGSKTKNSGNGGVFSAKREKLRHLAANKSLYNVDEPSSKGFDMVSSLISRILPVNQENRETHSGHAKLPSFSKGHEATKRKLMEFHHMSYLGLDDGFHMPRSTNRLTDMDLMEWNPTCSESPFAPQSNIQYNHYDTKPYNRTLIEAPCTGIFRNSYFDDPFPRCESSNFNKLVEPDFQNEPELLEPPHSHTLLLGWENNYEKDNESFISSTSPDNDYQLYMTNSLTYSPPISPYINDRHLKKEPLLTSPYTPKHLMAVEEDCRINFLQQDYNTWCMDKSLNEKEHKSFLFLIQSPANNFLHALNTGLHSFVVDDENEEEFMYKSDQLLEGLDKVKDYGYMEAFYDTHFDCPYPLLLHDSSREDEM